MGTAATTRKERPRLRTGVVTRAGTNAGHLFIRLPDQRELEVSQLEWGVTKLMDGSRSSPELVEEAKKLGWKTTVVQVDRLIQRLRDSGVITSAEGDKEIDWPESSTELELDIPMARLLAGGPIAWSDDSGKEEGSAPIALFSEVERPQPLERFPTAVSEDAEDFSFVGRPLRLAGRRNQILVGIGCLGVAVAVGWIVERPLHLVEPMTVHAAARHEARADATGLLAEAKKRIGDRVEQGETIAVLENRDVTAELSAVDKQLREVEAEIASIESKAPSLGAQVLRRALAFRTSELEAARKKLSELESPGIRRGGPAVALQRAREDVARKQRVVNLVRIQLLRARAQFRIPELRAKEASLFEALHTAQENVLRLEIKSPLSGVIVGGELLSRGGVAVERGRLIAEVAQVDTMRAEIMVPESEVNAVSVGLPVAMKVRTYPGIEFFGKVNDIGPIASPITADRPMEGYVRVGVALKNDRGLILDGMNGYARIECGARPILDLLFRPVLSWMRLRFLV
jgi:multidrug efflux pump subunit AcrA (membrane-fusion protein)